MRSTTMLLLLACLTCAVTLACRESPGEPGSMTPPNDTMSTGRGGLGMPVNDVGTDAGYLGDVMSLDRAPPNG